MDESKLAIAMIMKGEEVPEDILESAVNHLEVMCMGLNEDAKAHRYVLGILIDGIREQDAGKIEWAVELIESTHLDGPCNHFDDGPDDDWCKSLEPTEAVSGMIDKTIDDFIGNEFEAKGAPVAAGVKTLEQLGRHGFIPLKYENGYLVGFDQKSGDIVVMSINNKMTRQEFVDHDREFEHPDVLQAVVEQWELPEAGVVAVSFVNLMWRLIADDKFILQTEQV